MNSKERVNLAFRHKEPDRVPVGELHIMPHVSSEVLGREAITGEGKMFFQRAKLLADGRRDEYVDRFANDSLELIRMIGHDLIMMELNPPKELSYKITEISDTGWVERDIDSGLWRKFIYEKEKQVVLEVDSTEKQEKLRGIRKHLDVLEKSECSIDSSCFDATRVVCDSVKDELFCMAKIPDLIPSNRSWYTDFMEISLLEPELTRRICDLYTLHALKAAEGFIECGVHGVMIATDWAMNSGPIFPPRFIREYLVPQVNTIADYCHDHGVVVMKHTDGNIMPIAELFFTMNIDAYQSIEPFAGMELKTIKDKYGDSILLMGNVDCGRTLPYGRKEDIIEETKNCIKAGAAGGGYILSSSNTISYPISVSAMMTMVEAVMKYGTYPIEL